MAGNLDGFDASRVDPNVGYEPVPAGDYTVIATDSEFKETKDGKGRYLQFSLEIVEGEHKGQIVFDRLNLDNPNETAVKIAKGTLSAICHAVGVMRPKDSSELHGKPMIAKVVTKPYNGGLSNEVKGYKAVSSSKTITKGDGEGDNTPPWKR